MRYHQGRAIRQHELFVRNCKVCGIAIMILIVAIGMAAS